MYARELYMKILGSNSEATVHVQVGDKVYEVEDVKFSYPSLDQSVPNSGVVLKVRIAQGGGDGTEGGKR